MIAVACKEDEVLWRARTESKCCHLDGKRFAGAQLCDATRDAAVGDRLARELRADLPTHRDGEVVRATACQPSIATYGVVPALPRLQDLFQPLAAY